MAESASTADVTRGAVTAPGGSTQQVTLSGVTFALDSTWHTAVYPWYSTASMLVAYVSNQPMHPPCTDTKSSGGEETSCSLPLEHLADGGLLISWFMDGVPGLNLTSAPGAPTAVGGHQARLYTGPANRDCAAIGGTTSLTATIIVDHQPTHEDLLVGDACLTRDSDKAKARATLTSARL